VPHFGSPFRRHSRNLAKIPFMCISYPIKKFKSNSEGGILIDTQKGVFTIVVKMEKKSVSLYSSLPAYFLIARKDIVDYTRLAAISLCSLSSFSSLSSVNSVSLFSSVIPSVLLWTPPSRDSGQFSTLCPLYFCWNNSDNIERKVKGFSFNYCKYSFVHR